MSKKLSILLIGLSLLFMVFTFACGGETALEPQSFSVTVLHTNDTHGHPLKFFNYPDPDLGGMPARATLVNQIREEEENVLVLDAGDVLTGLPVSNLHQAEPDIIGMNYIGYDAMAVGNHEFDMGRERLAELEEMMEFPLLSANIYENGKPAFQEYEIFEFEVGTDEETGETQTAKVAVFGLTTHETPTMTMPDYVEGLEFRDPVEVAKKLVPELKKKAHVVIALTHMGFYDGVESSYYGDETLAREVDGIDVIIGGHSHTMFEDGPVKINNTWIHSSKEWGLYLGRLNITVEAGEVVDVMGESIPVNSEIEEDADLLAVLTEYADQVEELLGVVISNAEEAFTWEKALIRSDDYPITNMVCDAMREEAGVDIFLQNSGGIRAGIPQGEIKKAHVHAVLPFTNTVQLMEMTGAEIMTVLEYAASIEDGNGAFLQVSGLTYTLNRTEKTVSNVALADGSGLEPEAVYLVGTNSFMKAGGDGYEMLKPITRGFYDTSLFQYDMVISYLEKRESINPADYDDNRIEIVE